MLQRLVYNIIADIAFVFTGGSSEDAVFRIRNRKFSNIVNDANVGDLLLFPFVLSFNSMVCALYKTR